MYFRPSASHTWTPRARSHTMGQPPSGSAPQNIARLVVPQQIERFGGFVLDHHTPRWSGGQMNLCAWSWNRTGNASAMICSASCARVIGV